MTIGFLLEKWDDNWKKIFKELRNEFQEHSFICSFDQRRSKIIEESDVLILENISMEELCSANNLKVIFTPFVGVNELPIEKLRELNIKVSNSHWTSKYVAEKAIGLALAVMGRTVEFHKRLEKGLWSGYLAKELEYQYWSSLFGKKCSILGYGVIGKVLGKLLKPFGCSIKAFKRNISEESSDPQITFTNDLKYSLTDIDVCFNTLPLTNETKHLINSTNIHWLQDSFFINVGRGSVIEERALFDALKTGIIKGAGIDVWYCYPQNEWGCFPSLYPFHTLPNVVLSPHTASDSFEGFALWADSTAKRIRKFLLSGEITNSVSLEQGY